MSWMAVLTWIPMIFIAVGNGVLRERTYGKRVPERAAHQISTFTAMVFLGIYIFALSRFRRLESPGAALSVGALWVLLTVAFEFGFGRFVAGHSWKRLLQDYNVTAGRLWTLLLLWLLIAPVLFLAP